MLFYHPEQTHRLLNKLRYQLIKHNRQYKQQTVKNDSKLFTSSLKSRYHHAYVAYTRAHERTQTSSREMSSAQVQAFCCFFFYKKSLSVNVITSANCLTEFLQWLTSWALISMYQRSLTITTIIFQWQKREDSMKCVVTSAQSATYRHPESTGETIKKNDKKCSKSHFSSFE